MSTPKTAVLKLTPKQNLLVRAAKKFFGSKNKITRPELVEFMAKTYGWETGFGGFIAKFPAFRGTERGTYVLPALDKLPSVTAAKTANETATAAPKTTKATPKTTTAKSTAVKTPKTPKAPKTVTGLEVVTPNAPKPAAEPTEEETVTTA